VEDLAQIIADFMPLGEALSRSDFEDRLLAAYTGSEAKRLTGKMIKKGIIAFDGSGNLSRSSLNGTGVYPEKEPPF
jgi:hypothetical protein